MFNLLKKRTGSIPIQADLSAPHGNVGVRPGPPVTQRNVLSGAMSRIRSGLFGIGSPANTSAAEVNPLASHLYQFYEGGIFTNGTENYVFEYPWEFPLQTIWGNAFLRKPNTFNPIQPPQVYSNPNVLINGIGGVVAGQIVRQPLESNGE